MLRITDRRSRRCGRIFLLDRSACGCAVFRRQQAALLGQVILRTGILHPTVCRCQLIGEDAQAVAGRLLCEAWLKRASERDFNRPLMFPERGWM